MVGFRPHSQNQRNPQFAHDFYTSDKPAGAYTVPSYKPYTQSRSYYQGQQNATRHTHARSNPESHVNVATDAQVTAYQDAAVTKVWHDEWEAELDDFGTPRPLLLVNRATDIDMKHHALRTKLVYLCYWDQDHEPDGVIAQRLARAKRSREKEQFAAHTDRERDMRRKRVRKAAQSAEIIDLTGDDDSGERRSWNYAGVENVENHPPGTFAHPWRI